MLHTCVGCGRYKVWDEEDVMDIVYDNPWTSTYQVSSATGLPKSAVCHTLHGNQLCSFHVWVKRLHQGDTHLCPQFLRWMLHKIVDTPQFLCYVLWNDKAVFTGSSVCNQHNLHILAVENPYATITSHSNKDLVSMFGLES
jgi:hypothetical protein